MPSRSTPVTPNETATTSRALERRRDRRLHLKKALPLMPLHFPGPGTRRHNPKITNQTHNTETTSMSFKMPMRSWSVCFNMLRFVSKHYYCPCFSWNMFAQGLVKWCCSWSIFCVIFLQLITTVISIHDTISFKFHQMSLQLGMPNHATLQGSVGHYRCASKKCALFYATKILCHAEARVEHLTV